MPQEVILRGMTWSDPRGYDPLVAASGVFHADHPQVRINWEKRSLQGFESTPVDELARTYDLMVIDHPHVGAIVEEKCLTPIDQFASANALTRLAGETVGKSFESYFYHGHQWALPIDAACQVQAIRPDLMANPVTNFDQIIDETKLGHVILPLRPPHVLMSFFTLMANLGTPFPVASGDKIHVKSAHQAFAMMQALFDAVDPACRTMDPIAALNALSEGNRFALCPLTYLYAPYSQDGYRDHLITYHDIPAIGASGPLGSALGGTGIAISAQTKHPELCTRFALWLASAEVQSGLYVNNNGQPGNARAWADASVNAAVNDAYSNTRMTHEAAWLRPRHAGYMGFQEAGSHILLDALTNRTQFEIALPALQASFEESFPQ